MNACPRDAGQLSDYLVQTHSVGRCATCAGLWLPGPVVTAMLGRLALPPGTASPTTLQCPDDRSQLLAVKHRGVQIDVCSSCGGVWLDRGELERIVRQGRKASLLDGADPVDGVGGVGELLSNVDVVGGAGDLLSGAGELAGEAAGFVLEFIFEALSGF